MNISKNGINLIKEFEGLKLEAYKCPAGIWTIGFGHTGKDVFKGLKITLQEAHNFLYDDLKIHCQYIEKLIKVPINQNQIDSLVSFEYNIGYSAFKNSTLLKLLNEKNYTKAANEFDKWVFCNGKKLNGLVKRRKKEKELFLK